MTVTETTDYHVPQFDGDGGYCDSKNCAAASGAVAVHGGTGGRVRMSADTFRGQANVSCVPGVSTPSGGLRFSDVSRVAALHGVTIDYGWVDGKGYTRWAPATLALRCSQDWGAILPGDYDQLHEPYRAPGSTFMGDHSVRVHRFRGSDGTYCWHDPLRKTGIRVPASVVNAFWQKETSTLRGIVGFYHEPAKATPPSDPTGVDEMIRYATITETGNRMTLRDGQRLYDSPGGKVVTKMSRDASVRHVGLAGQVAGKAWRAVVVGTGVPYADGKTRRTVLYVPSSAGEVVPV